MTDAWLMEADCIHGRVWFECRRCSSRSYAERRSALKGRVLMGASILVSEGAGFETWSAAATDLGLSAECLDAVVAEVADELWRRSLRHPTASELALRAAGE